MLPARTVVLVVLALVAGSAPEASRARAQDDPAIDGAIDPEAGEGAPVSAPVSAPAPVEPEPAPVAPPTVSPSAGPAAPTAPVENASAEEPTTGFFFGSYGRVVVASDLRGHTGGDTDLILHSPRIDESTYAELELRREDDFDDVHTRIVATLAIAGPLFHFDGEFDARIAVRNLFAEARNAITHGLSLWVGSRMVRGDDVYLLDFWPLDNLNMVGGGARYEIARVAEAAVTAGFARPNESFYHQTVTEPSEMGFLPIESEILDRPRLVLSARGTYWPLGRDARRGLKGVLYGETHHIASGVRRTTAGELEALPADGGWVLGAQVGAYDADKHWFVNLFARYADGLAVYDPLGLPFPIGRVIDTSRASELSLALSGNFEHDFFGLQVGAWYRRFRDADPNSFEGGERAEGVLTLRPHVWIGERVGVAGEVSYQAFETSAIRVSTGEQVSGTAWKLGIVPFYSPAGRGTYTRPHLRLIYNATIRDEGARASYGVLDHRSAHAVEHFFGLGVEWWFNSTSYQ